MRTKEIIYNYNSNKNSKYIISSNNDFIELSNLEIKRKDRIFLFIDKNVNKIWGENLFKQLEKNNKEIISYDLPPKESTKSFSFIKKIISFLSDSNCGRNDLIISCGGGTILDLCAFVSSIYMRGLTFYAIPTTLIGQVDVLTAGKTCLNFKNTKNLLGTFYYPDFVYNNSSILQTCPMKYQRQGFSEVFKYGILASNRLVDILRKFSQTSDIGLLREMIELTMNARVKISKIDPLASNLGHTFGHALESLFNFQLLHGDAISIGTVMALNFAAKKRIITVEEKNKIFNLMKDIGLNIYIEENLDIKKMAYLMTKDKKSSKNNIGLVLITAQQKIYFNNDIPFYETNQNEILSFLEDFMVNYEYKVQNLISYLNVNKFLKVS